MKLVIEDHCIRCGICIDVCADLFEMDKKNDVMLVKVNPTPDRLLDCAREAIQACAVQAIQMKE